METLLNPSDSISKGTDIINKAQSLDLDPRILYEAVIDLSSEGLLTANAINMAAGILLEGLGLPNYFFKNIKKESLKHLLESIATSIKVQNDKVILYDRVAHVDFDLENGSNVQRVRIATRTTRDSMEKVLEDMIAGHRREYYFSPKSNYYTYIVRPETVNDYTKNEFKDSRFLFALAGDFTVTPAFTRQRYEKFLKAAEKSISPLIELFNLPETGETRLMFNSDFKSPQLPILRKLFEEHGLVLARAYWEPYSTKSSVHSSICSLYVLGEISRKKEVEIIRDLSGFLSFSISGITDLYLGEKLTFNEMLFAGNAVDFTHMFIFKESENATDMEVMESLVSKDHRDAFTKRLQGSNKSTYGSNLIEATAKTNSDLIKILYDLFDRRFNPARTDRLTQEALDQQFNNFNKIIASRFMDHQLDYDIFKFMFKLVSCTLKTNFYKHEKRSFAFRFDSRILDPLVFNQFVFGIFFVNGHYACGTHLRADDIARGGLRLIRVSTSNHEAELDNAVLLNYALGPKAQRLKHKDICESGSKGVVVPHALYSKYSWDALYDYTEGIMDLMMPDDSIVDYYGKPEMIFFGPDEGTAPLMDAVALNARARGYKYWRTITTGKSFGIPHDTYGLLDNGDLFGLIERGEQGTDLQINGCSMGVTTDMDKIHEQIGDRIIASGMTTTGIMSTFRTLIAHYGRQETDLNLMITGGPDGDLGANEIQCYKGKICLIIDGGSILFDPLGLDRGELMKIAFMRHTSPRENSLCFPQEKLSPRGFKVPISAKNLTLPDGTQVEDGALFHRTFLSEIKNRKYIQEASIEAFIPCGGFKDTINHDNVNNFLAVFKEIKFIVEGANVFFDDASRRHIATSTAIKHIKDTTANKGGVFSSSVAEVLTGFLLGEDYEEKLLNDTKTRWALIRDIMALVTNYAAAETTMLIKIHEQDPSVPLFDLSEQTSEQIFALQRHLDRQLPDILKNRNLVWKIMEHYIPGVLIQQLGKTTIMEILNSGEMQSYRNAIITKKLASMAFYRYGPEWNEFLKEIETDFSGALHRSVQTNGMV
ncbi:GdhA3 [Desulforapulum autotrophicum HRM2]|uniref:GdhA3 n=1 Tax=Desulforapulum autotrophicum (strain ATCC 43914 / DSM 3382 / VKM B-1955 / HRM2) TaxID=177437 RepID=C0QAW6_DESAH|nr:NAD-glutamate dehydrogenase domain-containing protein [Desulforapulum autotrophicum]ACN16899.1 GdhA3 [Desulforapulum autotrophicum HRM2]